MHLTTTNKCCVLALTLVVSTLSCVAQQENQDEPNEVRIVAPALVGSAWLLPRDDDLLPSQVVRPEIHIPDGFRVRVCLNGEVTDQLVRSLGTLPSLEELELDRASGYKEESLAVAVSSKTLRRVLFDACPGVGRHLLQQVAQNQSIKSVTFINIPLDASLLKELSNSKSLRELIIENASGVSAQSIRACFQDSLLTQLRVSAVQNGEMGELLKITTLESLSVGAGTIDASFAEGLVKHPNLRRLSLVGCDIDPKPILASVVGRNNKVNTLRIWGSTLRKLDPDIGSLLELFESLTVIQLGYLDSVTGALVRKLRKTVVEEISFDWCTIVTDDAVSELSLLEPKVMSLIGTPLRQIPKVNSFRKLRTLSLSDLTLSADFLRSLAGCENLSALTIDNCAVASMGDLNDWLIGLGSLKKLHLDCSKMRPHTVVEVLSKSRMIEDLSLNGATGFADSDVISLKHLPLRRLSVRGSALTGAALASFADLPSLEVLDLRFCEKVTAVPFELKDPNTAFPKLRAVYLRGADPNGLVARWLCVARSDLYVAN